MTLYYYYYCFKKNYPFCKEKQALILPNPNDDDAMQRAQHKEDKTLNTHVYSPLSNAKIKQPYIFSQL